MLFKAGGKGDEVHVCNESLPSGRGNTLTLRVCCLLGVVNVTRPLESTCTVSDRDGVASSFTLLPKHRTHNMIHLTFEILLEATAQRWMASSFSVLQTAAEKPPVTWWIMAIFCCFPRSSLTMSTLGGSTTVSLKGMMGFDAQTSILANLLKNSIKERAGNIAGYIVPRMMHIIRKLWNAAGRLARHVHNNNKKNKD